LSQQIPEPENALATADPHQCTVRQSVHLSISGFTLRVRSLICSAHAPFKSPLPHRAPLSTSSPAIDPASDPRAFLFRPGRRHIPAGAEYLSDR